MASHSDRARHARWGSRMIPLQFDYCAPETLDGALQELAAHANAKLIGGGQALLPALTRRLTTASKLVDLRQVTQLRGIVPGAPLRIGATTPLDEIAEIDKLGSRLPALLDALGAMSDPVVLHRSTLGGNL